MVFNSLKGLKFLSIPACLFFCFTALTCNYIKQDSKPHPITFNIDSTQIGKEVVLNEYNITFNAPANIAHSKEMIDTLNKNVRQDGSQPNGLQTNLVDAFMDDKLNMLVVSSIQSPVNNQAIINIKQVSDNIKTQLKGSDIKFAEYLKDSITVNQFIIRDSVNVIFKVLFANPSNQILQFDYIIPRNNFNSQIKAVESSIGTIKYLKK